MINITGDVFVTNLKEVSPRLITGTVYSFEKVGEEFKTTFIKAKFVGKAIEHLIVKNVKDKDKVHIVSGVLKSNEWTTKDGKENKTLEVTCFELKEVEINEYKEVKKEDKNNRFKRWNEQVLEEPIEDGDLPW